MATRPDIRSQLRTLSIPKDQRPAPASAAPSRPASVPIAARSSRWPIGLVILLFVGAGFYFGSQKLDLTGMIGGDKAEAAPLRLVTVTSRDLSQPMPILTATGKIVSDHKVLVNTKVSGQIVDLLFEQGDRVEKGQVLARIEDVIYRARRDEAAAQVEQARASVAYQKINFARIKDLFERNAAPDIEFAAAKRDFDEATARLSASEATLVWAQKALTDCEVQAPIAGVLLERNVEVGDFVAAEGGRGAIANAQLCTIADMTKLRVEVDISELDIARLKSDMPATIIPDAYKDRKYNGHVMWLDPGANYSKATVQVKVRIDDPDDFLRVEGSAQVAFLAEPLDTSATAQSGSSIWIPASACQREQTGSSGKVFVAVDGRLKAVSIQLGRQVGNQIEVVSGLASGQSIVVDGLDNLTDGQRLPS